MEMEEAGFTGFLQKLQNNQLQIIIYGAGNTADTLLFVLEKEFPGLNIIGCAVSENVSEGKMLRGVPVKNINNYIAYKDSAVVLIAVVDKYLPDIVPTLKKLQFSHVENVSFESSHWEDVRENYFKKFFRKQGKEYHSVKSDLKLGTGKDIMPKVYMACSHVDKPLSEAFNPDDTDYLVPIQVGKALTNAVITPISDNTGGTISYKNNVYSELTALYWIWKNVSDEWVGLCHYRRHFMLTSEEISRIPRASFDIVLTTPILNIPSVTAVYQRDHEIADWKIMMEILAEMYPKYEMAALKFFKGEYYCGYNMFIASKTVIDEYCAWLFPLLSQIEERSPHHGDIYQNRYIGFLAERLFSLYFMSGIRDFRIAYACKHFYM